MKMDVYSQVTSKIVSELEKGVVPWRKPWRQGLGGIPKNLVTNKPYQGINVLLLMLEDYDSSYWLTFKQARAAGGHVRKGEKGSRIVFWKFLEKESDDGEIEKVPMAKSYTVFNLEQCEGLEPETTTESEETSASKIIANWEDKPEVRHAGGKACYDPRLDLIHMPKQKRFTSANEYYSTLFHEAIHATGHKSRLGRKGITEAVHFASHEYSKEELVAELGASFLCARAGIGGTLENSVAYIQGWLKKLKSDKKLIVSAASKAQKASNYILGK